ncbi:hypothetical protein [uncultured Faecalibaculum sp.]|uniref:hypothetical protein n=1 Tax=uncultured Faecalibaculum sp. TaxID=1729681 RepID=UPI00262459AA|nr:hypothetical protein [uncultured Faecalibaculum sp.]
MAEKDIFERHFLEFPDVAADVIRLAARILGDVDVTGLQPEDIRNIPVHTFRMKEEEGQPEGRERDGNWL